MRLAKFAVPAVLTLLTTLVTVAGASAAEPTYDVDRLWGADRFATSAAVSQRYYPASGVPVTYIANGLNFPDALSAAPAAAREGGPLLIVRPDSIPDVISTELNRLAPRKIVVVGGPSVVSDQVYAQLSAHAATINRVSGSDRYETSLAISRYAFPAGSSTRAFIATGRNFPDALAAAGAAGAAGGPVILVDGSSTSGPTPAVTTELNRLGVTNVVLAGSPPVVYPQIERRLNQSYQVERYAGADRYGTSGVINRESFTSAGHIFVATGAAFPDALAAAAVAGARHEPLYVSPANCIPPYVREDLETRGVTAVTLVGSTGVLGSGAEALSRCPLPQWLVKLNQVRSEANLPALVENVRYSGDIAAHIFYLEKTGQFQHGEDPNNEWYTERGANGGSNLMDGGTLRTENWLNAPFHLADFLDPGVNAAGAYGHYYSGEGTSWIEPGATGVQADPVASGWPRAWPSSSTVLPAELTVIGNEWPNPVSSCGRAYTDRFNQMFPQIGLPIYVAFDPNAADITTATATFKRGSTTLTSCVVTGATYTNPDADAQALGRNILNSHNAVYVVPLDPLALNTTYTLSVTTNRGSMSTSVRVGNS
ncbi:cell wall-binding repeat-containing protein [Micromonospora sp. NBC_00617]|uniref:cell wall-binding repeat-containing protein n=1 Tax=Micromonospora sp. NBC_00617 TaxID=2903587 RepID=UPI0030E0FAD4